MWNNLDSYYFTERNKARGPNKDFLQKLDSVSYQLSSLDQDLQLRVQQPLPHDRHALDISKQQQGVSIKTCQFSALSQLYRCMSSKLHLICVK